MRDAFSIVVKQQMAANKKSMPILDALNANNNAFIEALDEIAGEVESNCLGYCETCSLPLFEGDQGFHEVEAGLYFCAEHSPTYQDWESAVADEPEAYEDKAARERGLQEIQEHLDAGGSLTDKITHEIS